MIAKPSITWIGTDIVQSKQINDNADACLMTCPRACGRNFNLDASASLSDYSDGVMVDRAGVPGKSRFA